VRKCQRQRICLPNVVWQVEEEVEAYADIPKTEVEVVNVARRSGLGHITV